MQTNHPANNEFRLIVKALEINDDGIWAVQVKNELGQVEDKCKLTLKGNSIYSSYIGNLLCGSV